MTFQIPSSQTTLWFYYITSFCFIFLTESTLISFFIPGYTSLLRTVASNWQVTNTYDLQNSVIYLTHKTQHNNLRAALLFLGERRESSKGLDRLQFHMECYSMTSLSMAYLDAYLCKHLLPTLICLHKCPLQQQYNNCTMQSYCIPNWN